MPQDNIVYIEVSGLTGTGKSAVYTEIATALAAIGLKVEHADPGDADTEMRMNGIEQLERYSPRVILSERNLRREIPKKPRGRWLAWPSWTPPVWVPFKRQTPSL